MINAFANILYVCLPILQLKNLSFVILFRRYHTFCYVFFARLSWQIRKQPSPNSCKYLKVVVNLQANVNFNFRIDSATFKLLNR